MRIGGIHCLLQGDDTAQDGEKGIDAELLLDRVVSVSQGILVDVQAF